MIDDRPLPLFFYPAEQLFFSMTNMVNMCKEKEVTVDHHGNSSIRLSLISPTVSPAHFSLLNLIYFPQIMSWIWGPSQQHWCVCVCFY